MPPLTRRRSARLASNSKVRHRQEASGERGWRHCEHATDVFSHLALSPHPVSTRSPNKTKPLKSSSLCPMSVRPGHRRAHPQQNPPCRRCVLERPMVPKSCHRLLSAWALPTLDPRELRARQRPRASRSPHRTSRLLCRKTRPQSAARLFQPSLLSLSVSRAGRVTPPARTRFRKRSLQQAQGQPPPSISASAKMRAV